MNYNETLDFLTQFERLTPAYAKWRTEQAHALAGMHATKPEDELRAMVASMARTLEDVTTSDAAEVLGGMETGQVEIPPYGGLAMAVRMASMQNRDGRTAAARYDRESQPRYSCLDCRDSGIVEVFNPLFVHDYRATFMEYGGKLPADWYGPAYRWWLGQQRGPMIHVALCDCRCDARERLLVELNLARGGKRKLGNRPLGLPACGNYLWDRRETTRVDGPLRAGDCLAGFYRHLYT